jgi:hypothetical protein
MNHNSIAMQPISPIPPNNVRRYHSIARSNRGESLPRLGLLGDTYTILRSGEDDLAEFGTKPFTHGASG